MRAKRIDEIRRDDDPLRGMGAGKEFVTPMYDRLESVRSKGIDDKFSYYLTGNEGIYSEMLGSFAKLIGSRSERARLINPNIPFEQKELAYNTVLKGLMATESGRTRERLTSPASGNQFNVSLRYSASLKCAYARLWKDHEEESTAQQYVLLIVP